MSRLNHSYFQLLSDRVFTFSVSTNDSLFRPSLRRDGAKISRKIIGMTGKVELTDY
jgi:hypothetical protein